MNKRTSSTLLARANTKRPKAIGGFIDDSDEDSDTERGLDNNKKVRKSPALSEEDDDDGQGNPGLAIPSIPRQLTRAAVSNPPPLPAKAVNMRRLRMLLGKREQKPILSSNSSFNIEERHAMKPTIAATRQLQAPVQAGRGSYLKDSTTHTRSGPTAPRLAATQKIRGGVNSQLRRKSSNIQPQDSTTLTNTTPSCASATTLLLNTSNQLQANPETPAPDHSEFIESAAKVDPHRVRESISVERRGGAATRTVTPGIGDSSQLKNGEVYRNPLKWMIEHGEQHIAAANTVPVPASLALNDTGDLIRKGQPYFVTGSSLTQQRQNAPLRKLTGPMRQPSSSARMHPAMLTTHGDPNHPDFDATRTQLQDSQPRLLSCAPIDQYIPADIANPEPSPRNGSLPIHMRKVEQILRSPRDSSMLVKPPLSTPARLSFTERREKLSHSTSLGQPPLVTFSATAVGVKKSLVNVQPSSAINPDPHDIELKATRTEAITTKQHTEIPQRPARNLRKHDVTAEQSTKNIKVAPTLRNIIAIKRDPGHPVDISALESTSLKSSAIASLTCPVVTSSSSTPTSIAAQDTASDRAVRSHSSETSRNLQLDVTNNRSRTNSMPRAQKGKGDGTKVAAQATPSSELADHSDMTTSMPEVTSMTPRPRSSAPVETSSRPTVNEPAQQLTAFEEEPNLVINLTGSTNPAPDAVPYFEYTIHQKLWSDSQPEDSVSSTEIISHPYTCIDEANAQAEKLFKNMREQYQQHFQVHFSEWRSERDEHGCDMLSGAFARLENPEKKSHTKIWVRKDYVSAYAGNTIKAMKPTSFVATTAYVLRLFKIFKATSDGDSQEATSDTDITFTRIYHPLPRTECYTTLHAANRAARDIQAELSLEQNPNEATRLWQEQIVKKLNDKLRKLEQVQDRMGHLWKSRFNGLGLGSDRFELVVEKATLCGPRNL